LSSKDFILIQQALFNNHSSITSPNLYDPSTTIGRSDPFLEGSSTDLNGASVGDGSHDQIVKDSDLSFPTHPPLPDSTNSNNREIHTEVYSVNLRELSKAADDPKNYERPISHWTGRELAEELVKQGRFRFDQLGLAEKVHKTNLDATGREKW
jgi:hypothetical protein